MRILYFFCDDESYMSQWQYVHIFDELSHFGYSIEVYNPLQFQTIEAANEKLINFIQNSSNRFDVFMSCVGSEYLYRETIESVKKIGLPTLLICFDNLHAPYMHKKIAAIFDIVWLTSFETKWMFEKWGCKNIVVQSYAANPFNFKPALKEQIPSVAFIGTPYGSRVNKINLLTKSNVSCVVYANNLTNNNANQVGVDGIHKNATRIFMHILNALSFDIGRSVLLGALSNKMYNGAKTPLEFNDFFNLQPTVSFDEMQTLYSNYCLSLNITELRNTYVLKRPIHKLHLRTFEIPMCGGLEIASYTPELASYFEDGKEIILYDSEEEFISKAKFYLSEKNRNLCLKLKMNARKRAEAEHTWMKRFQNLDCFK